MMYQDKIIRVEKLFPLLPNNEAIRLQNLQTQDLNRRIISHKMLTTILDCLINGNPGLRLRSHLLPVHLRHKEVEYNNLLETLHLLHLIIFLNFPALQSPKVLDNENLQIMYVHLHHLVLRNQPKTILFFNPDSLQ